MDLTKAEIIEQIGELSFRVFNPSLPFFLIQGRSLSGVQNEGKIENCQFSKICRSQNTVIFNIEERL